LWKTFAITLCRLLAMVGAVGQRELRKPLLREFFDLSVRHPDGQGPTFYEQGRPTVIKGPGTATTSKLLPAATEGHASDLIIAHIQDGTKGKRTVETPPSNRRGGPSAITAR
jgi:predicted glutamine amidotransferase